MRLRDSYYKITGITRAEGATVFQVELLAGCRVYRGHFPGNPVSPGACNIQMVKELAERMAGQTLHLTGIRQCRMTAVMSPQTTPSLAVTVSLTPSEAGLSVTTTIAAADNICLTLKGELTP